MKPDTIYVLSDPYVETGSLWFSLSVEPFEERGIQVKRITSDFIRSGEIITHPNSVLILPGSNNGDGYRTHMNGQGFANERLYLEAGGRSLRICAAAYMAYESYGFQDRRYSSLSYLFEGHAHGPIEELYNPLRPWRNLMDTHDIAMLDHFHSDGSVSKAASAYSCGPRLPETEGARIIARFQDAQNRTPAVLATQIGQGLSVVSSVALEINGAITYKATSSDNENVRIFREYAKALAAHEPERSQLWKDVWDNYLLAEQPSF